MVEQKELKVLQAVILLCDGVSEGKLMLELGFGPQLKKAKEIIKIIKK